ncbi:putative aldouronate transport system substrate-binding protein [Arthrobacter pigmenti]|uniref:Putative aldouronate transport system substrate-binding protein n=1 Tax=Arthrobacter pigmenti TaxID=271432 RepID=A0A846S049_9MICC|nr:sugar ABC transporter substrate-binding protein [Arthrobacter pigmenti]NJC23801.1 putative aldouronate transport system substrate-binding protein [Arthrobacter pigmenti]
MTIATSGQPGFSRRGFLGLAGLAVTTIGLSACSGTGGTGNGGASASATVKLPTFKEFTGTTPAIAGNSKGLQAAYFKLPDPIQSVKSPPLKGTVTGLTETFEVMSPAMDDNPFWQRLNEKLGGRLELQIAQDIGDGYPAKFATVLASNDLPDMMWVPPNQGIPNVGAMLEAKFQDLTPYLSGDAVLEYPNLAALKPDSWKTAVVNGKIWGAPIPSTPFGQVYIGNGDAWAEVGGFSAGSAEEFLEKAKEMTRPSEQKWALAPDYINALHMVTEWYGAPNGWAVNKDRTLTHTFETDAYAAGIEFMVKMFAEGVIYPDAETPDLVARVVNGSIGAVVASGPHDLRSYRALDDAGKYEILVPFSATSGITPTYDMGYGTVGFTPFKKAEEGKIRELLSLINYLSAPFGTSEWLQKNYGTEGDDYTLDSTGNPIRTESGTVNAPGLVSALNIMSSPENVIFNPGYDDDTRYISETEQKLLEMAWRNPTNGSYSDTNARVGAKITTQVRDKVVDIITGRSKLDELQGAIKRWRSEGGDKMREEYQAALSPEAPVFSS